MTGEQKRLIDQYRCQGMGSTEIAGRLNLSVNTVKSYCRRTAVGTAGTGSESAPSGICEQCGKLMTARKDRRGKRFCSDQCRYQWWHLHRGESLNATEHVCPTCGRIFSTNRRQYYCCHGCYIIARYGGRNQNEANEGAV